MGTVSKAIADRVIAGEFKKDRPVKIVKYTNAFDGGDAYGLICQGENPNRYAASSFVINLVTYWEKGK